MPMALSLVQQVLGHIDAGKASGTSRNAEWPWLPSVQNLILVRTERQTATHIRHDDDRLRPKPSATLLICVVNLR